MATKSKSFLKGASILAGAGLAVKIIGILYRIPLANILGDEGMGIYHSAYPFYALLLTFSTAGLPPAVSKMVAERIAANDQKGALKVFKTALYVLTILGIIMASILYLSRDIMANFANDPESALAIAWIAPAIVLVSIMSAFRGYFQGLQNMVPTGASQIVEQVVKVIFGLWLAYLWLPKGLEYAAAGAVTGVMLSEAAALVSIIGYYMRHKRITKNEKYAIKSPQSTRSIIKRLTSLAVPILIGASVMPMVTMIDNVMIKGRMIHLGYTVSQARALFGIFAGMVNTLLNVPGVISLGLCISLVPAIATSYVTRHMKAVNEKALMGIKIAMLIGLPSAFGLILLGEPIMALLYRGAFSTETVLMDISINPLVLAGDLLSTIGVGVLFLSITQTINGILQGLGKVHIPIISLGFGAIVKIIVGYVLMSTQSVYIFGAAIGTVAFYITASIINLVMLKKYLGLKYSFLDLLVKPLIATLVMGGAVMLIMSFDSFLGQNIALIISIIVGIIIYIIALIFTKTITERELSYIPGGHRLQNLFYRKK